MANWTDDETLLLIELYMERRLCTGTTGRLQKESARVREDCGPAKECWA